MTDPPPTERRRHVRTEAVLKVEYTSTADFLADYLLDVSEGGLFIRTNLYFDIGAMLDFEVSFPGLLEPLALRGEVRWAQPAPDPGVGVQLAFETEERKNEIAQLLSVLRGERRTSIPPSRRGCRVLLFEDNSLIVSHFRRMAAWHTRDNPSARQFDLVVASTGDEAMERLDHGPYDLAIVDHFVPGMTGDSVIRRVRSDERLSSMPIVATSGDDDVRGELLEAGADLFLRKPLQFQQLISTVDRLLQLGDPEP